MGNGAFCSGSRREGHVRLHRVSSSLTHLASPNLCLLVTLALTPSPSISGAMTSMPTLSKKTTPRRAGSPRSCIAKPWCRGFPQIAAGGIMRPSVHLLWSWSWVGLCTWRTGCVSWGPPMTVVMTHAHHQSSPNSAVDGRESRHVDSSLTQYSVAES
ncbi:hypothetical protein C8F01DRAFT_754242 [Mycena amicta]|nr:hypothetical protein C8F01DRAFT_754242 [Mycena amicta]